jgi:hypothetical protein
MDIRKCITEYAEKEETVSHENSIGIDYIVDKIKSRITIPKYDKISTDESDNRNHIDALERN